MKHLDIIVLSDVSEPPPRDQDFTHDLKKDNWRTEYDVLFSLRESGHTARLICLYDSVTPLIDAVTAQRPDLIFNIAEQFRDQTVLERNIAAFLELLGIPYTGSGPTGLTLCRHKAMAKKILTYHRIRIPHFAIYHRHRAFHPPRNLKYPLFVKGAREEASIGISKSSFVDQEGALAERVQFIHDSLNQDALVEEFIEGREIYVSIVGNHRLTVFPLRELNFGDMPPDEPRFATFTMKWDEAYRKKWNIRNTFVDPLPNGIEQKISHISRRVYRALQIQGYGRIDLRLRPDGDVVVLEANPNPFLAAGEDFALSAKKAGLPHTALVNRIVRLAVNRTTP